VPSTGKRARQRYKSHPPPRERLTAANVAVGGALVGSAWSVVSVVAKLPEPVLAGGASAIGTITIWQAIKAKLESRGKDKP
jgi:hypothetical protein